MDMNTKQLGKPQRRSWTTVEEAILRETYPTGGSIGAHERLPHRSIQAINGHANSLGLHMQPEAAREMRRRQIAAASTNRYPQDERIDALIRETYLNGRGRGYVQALADKTGRSRSWIALRAAKLGVTHPLRPRPWLPEEERIIEDNADQPLAYLRRKLAAAGFARTQVAIQVRIYALSLSRRNPDVYTHADICRIFGVVRSTVAHWIQHDGLPDMRQPVGPDGVIHKGHITRARLRNWVRTHHELIDLRRVDQVMFKDLIFGAER